MKNVVLVCVLLLGVPFVLVGCGDKEPAKTNGDTSEQPDGRHETEQSSAEVKDIVDTAVANDDFKTLVAAVKAADLVETLKGTGPFTVFAPNGCRLRQFARRYARRFAEA